ncbi:dihydrodipicolinate synthase family protein [Rouxiella sp. S1S-2]|uniref:dihydrodipicolinate synthase family protein n=1 Tax=Rouxiella sp. S1S-2 TaxID=2653856 RepID=UPI00126410D5|nr:dihydrodipicolinate synthase family protein [Rouxiella sp. S1S-2]KAB7896373.1 dihydrodipicolinate synthase family protein [Rouxiella sp. S1S-2]
MNNITGVYTAIVTPFSASGELDGVALREQVKRQQQAGNNIFCNGTNGEFFMLNEQEKIRVTEICLEAAGSDTGVMSHVGEISTSATIRLGKHIETLGVRAVSVITPWFATLRPQELIAHFRAVADALTVPVYLYNIPARTGNTLTPAIVRELANHPNIKGIKDSAGSWESLQGFHEVSKQFTDFSVLTGPDSLIYRGFTEGSIGCISGIANIIPAQVNAVYRHLQEKNAAAAEAVQADINQIRTHLYGIAFSPAVVKKAVNLLGYNVGESRYPVDFTQDDTNKILAVIKDFNLRG